MTAEPPPSTPIAGPLTEARFVERPNRFLVRARIDERAAPVDAHLPDPGRLKELLIPGKRVWLRPEEGAHRKTSWTAVLVETPDGEGLVSMDTTLPTRLVEVALKNQWLEELGDWRWVRRELPLEGSRFDHLLERGGGGIDSAASTGSGSGLGPGSEAAGRPVREETPEMSGGRRVSGRKLVLEVKSVTLVEDGVALFPDAVTARGARHVRELAELAASGRYEAAILFVLQRSDAERILAARHIDPDFADALTEAAHAGVRILGRRCTVGLGRVVLGGAVEVRVG